jgi:hypothetical protein
MVDLAKKNLYRGTAYRKNSLRYYLYLLKENARLVGYLVGFSVGVFVFFYIAFKLIDYRDKQFESYIEKKTYCDTYYKAIDKTIKELSYQYTPQKSEELDILLREYYNKGCVEMMEKDGRF